MPTTSTRSAATSCFANNGIEPATANKLPAVNRLDVRFDKSFLFKSWTLAVYMDVQNLYNATNTEALIFDYRVREAVPVPGLPFLPVLGVKGSF